MLICKTLNLKKMKSFLHVGNCPIRDILSRLGDKWSLLVLVTLKTNGIMRFSDVHKSIGDISQRMLTVTLRSLEADGLINRKVYPEVPPRVEYSLTESGNGLMLHIKNLVDWALENMQEIVTSRQLYKNKKE
jgi:DNA-binding HxlR family transcriptional regulator